MVSELKRGTGTPAAKTIARQLDSATSERALAPIKVDTAFADLGTWTFNDDASGWEIEFRLFLSEKQRPGVPFVISESHGGAQFCRGDEYLDDLLNSKSRQHLEHSEPKVICIVWNQIEHPLEPPEIVNVIGERKNRLQARNVAAVLWTRELYPWTSESVEPACYHWGSLPATFLENWIGPIHTI